MIELRQLHNTVHWKCWIRLRLTWGNTLWVGKYISALSCRMLLRGIFNLQQQQDLLHWLVSLCSTFLLQSNGRCKQVGKIGQHLPAGK